MKSIEQRVALRVRRARESAGLTQEELAHRLGVDITALSRYERGRRAFGLEMLERAAHALDVSVTSFLTEARPVRRRDEEEELLLAYRALTPRQRRLAKWLVRQLRGVK